MLRLIEQILTYIPSLSMFFKLKSHSENKSCAYVNTFYMKIIIIIYTEINFLYLKTAFCLLHLNIVSESD